MERRGKSVKNLGLREKFLEPSEDLLGQERTTSPGSQEDRVDNKNALEVEIQTKRSAKTKYFKFIDDK